MKMCPGPRVADADILGVFLLGPCSSVKWTFYLATKALSLVLCSPRVAKATQSL